MFGRVLNRIDVLRYRMNNLVVDIPRYWNVYVSSVLVGLITVLPSNPPAPVIGTLNKAIIAYNVQAQSGTDPKYLVAAVLASSMPEVDFSCDSNDRFMLFFWFNLFLFPIIIILVRSVRIIIILVRLFVLSPPILIEYQ